ncbi:MAG: 50S ribosomal protein L18 [archaeon]
MRSIRRRRLESRTDYKARLSLLKSEKVRLVIRKSNRYLTAQLVSTDIAQDKVLTGVTSRDLLDHGWPKELFGSLKSLAAAYLTGKLLAKKSAGKTKEAILDMGMNRNVKKSRIYAVLAGAIAGGVKVICDSTILPTEADLIKNEKTAKIFAKLNKEL